MADHLGLEGATDLAQQPCSSGASRKRKRQDSDEVLARVGPLPELPIADNEYEQLDEEDDDADGCNGPSFKMKEEEYKEIQEAQEKATISQYGDIKITPFNLEEELEEGEFDKAGNFIFKKGDGDTDEEENDTWAESVNWADVERMEKEREQQKLDVEMKVNESKTTVIKRDRAGAYKEMLRLMRPDEIVKKTIQRLGNNVPKRKPFNKNAAKSKPQSGSVHDAQAASVEEARRKLDLMIELAHNRLEEGDIDIYQKSYEDLEEAIN